MKQGTIGVHRVTPALELSLTPVVVPIPGSSRPASIRDSAAATDVTLTPEQTSRPTAA
ncbi:MULTISPECIES: hypothetical protein [unclassified Streptomyces]|uniref:hypothetical protein n=1 Tax=unclassified Streptomyces TaxID=2593676 RepID=UPI0033A1941F